MDKLPIYKLVINEDEDSLEEVNFISLVEFPAIERNFDYFNIQKAKIDFAIQDEEERVVSGVMMIADLPIYRRDEQGEYYVVFTAEEIKKIVQKFFKKGYQSNVNLEHKIIADDVYLFESYIINREKGVNPPNGFEDIADGSWFGSHKIENDAIWAKVKDGTYKGFSVEGLFNYKMETTEDVMMSKIIEILKQIEH